MSENEPSTVIRWRSVWLGWTLVGGFSVLRHLATALGQERPVNWRLGVAYECLFVYVWALLTPFVFRWTQRHPVVDWWRISLRHLPAAMLTASAHLIVFFAIIAAAETRGRNLSQSLLSLRREAIYSWFTNLAIYAVLAVIFFYVQQQRERQNREAQLTAQLAQAELQNLRMQLQPHFLFNTLNAIAVLMMRDANAARRMLVRLSELLRLTLEHQATQEVSLKQELELLERYLEIERTRFQERLAVQMEVEADVLNAAVPILLLQPLVENAIRHGVSRKAEGGSVVIRARRQAESLQLQVCDDGLGLQQAPEEALQKGIGLSTTQARLERLYGAAQSFAIADRAEGGVCVTVTLPFHQHGRRDG